MSISRAKYAMGPSVMSSTVCAATGEASQTVAQDGTGVLTCCSSGDAQPQATGFTAGRQVAVVQKDFREAISAAVAVLNAQRMLCASLDAKAQAGQ
jgi:hypothetical protein